MTGRSRHVAVLAFVALSLVLAASASAKPIIRGSAVSSHTTKALPMGHVTSSDAAQRDPGPAVGTRSPDTGGLSTLAIVLIAAGGVLVAGSLGAVAGRRLRTGIPT